MTDEHDDLTRLLHGAVDDIEPRPGLQAIRSRTATKESPMTASRPWLLGALGGAVATAAVIGGVVLATNGDDRSGKEPDVAGTPSVSESASQTPTQSPSPSESAEAPSPSKAAEPPAAQRFEALPAYFVSDTAHGPRLYREFGPGQGVSEVDAAVRLAVEGDPTDPDYRSGWPEGVGVRSVEATPDLITVDLTGVPRERTGGMTVAEADMAIEQVIFTAQAAYGQGRVPVQLLLDGGRTDRMMGQPTSEGLAAGGVLETLSHVSVTTPSQGQVVTGDAIAVEGVANSFEANVLLELRPAGGGGAVLQDFATAEGYMDDKLFPFQKSLDVSGVAPGRYVLVVSTDDPSGGAEGNGPHVDTKVIEIR